VLGWTSFEKEPIDQDNPLLKMDNVIVLPHSAFYSDASSVLAPITIGKHAGKVLSGRGPIMWLNKSVKPKVKLIKER